MSLRTDLKTLLRSEVKLSNYCTMQVGGTARYFAEPSQEEELLDLIEFSRHENIPFFILGKGSNVIFPDEGYPGLVITLIHYELDRFRFDAHQCLLNASAGIHLYRLCLLCRDHGMGGAEFLANIPGTLGGALFMNAGFSRFPGQKSEISDLTEEVTVLDTQGVKETLQRSQLQFTYRHSNLEGKIVLGGTLRLWRRRPEEIQKEIQANFAYRNDKQDLKHPSSGSIFKNPAALQDQTDGLKFRSAGEIIEGLGVKGMRLGGAAVSPKHGNYIINTGGAKSSDIIQLIRKVQHMVFDATGFFLEPEVRIIEKS